VVERLVEDEKGLAGQRRQSGLQFVVQGAQALLEGGQVGLVARGIGRVGSGQVGGHLRGDYLGVGGQQPEVRVQAAGPVIVVVLIGVVVVMFVFVACTLTEVAQGQPR